MVFLTIALVGFALLAISAFFGGDHDVGFDHDISHDIGGHDAHAEGDGGPSIFSIRILSLFMAAFGAIGAITQHYGISQPLSLLGGIVGGGPIALAGWWFTRFLWSQQASSTVTTQDLLAEYGQVTIPIPASGTGQVSIEVKGQRTYQLARTKGGTEIKQGTRVLVVASDGNCLVVEPME